MAKVAAEKLISDESDRNADALWKEAVHPFRIIGSFQAACSLNSRGRELRRVRKPEKGLGNIRVTYSIERSSADGDIEGETRL